MDVQLKTIGLLIFMVIQGRVSVVDVSVRKGKSVVLPCGVETSVDNEYFKWEVILNGITLELADNLSGEPVCNVQIISCDAYPNGSVELHNIDEVDGARTYRCFRGGDGVFIHYSDHHLEVLPDDTAPEGETQALFDRETVHFAWSFQGDDGDIYAYQQPVCRNQGGMNLNVSCTPASGELVQEMSLTIDCTCYDSSGGVDTVKLGVREFDCPATTCSACWVVFIVAMIFLLLVVNAAAILVWFFYKRRDARNADNEKQESTPGSPKGDGDVHTDQEDESGELLGGKSKEDDSQTNKGNSGVKLYDLQTQRDTGEGGTIPVQVTDVLTEKNRESYGMQHGHTEKDWQKEYNNLEAIHTDYVTAINTTLKQKDEKIEEFRRQYEEQRQKFQNLSLKYAQMSDKILRSTSRTDEPDVASGGTVSLQREVSEAYNIGEHKADKQFHLTFSLERPGLKIVLSSCLQVEEGTKFELEFKDGKIETIMFGEKHPEYIQCSDGTVQFDLILDGCQLSLHEQSSDGAYPLMEREHKKFNLCSFLNTIKLNNSCVFTILRCDGLTARHR